MIQPFNHFKRKSRVEEQNEYVIMNSKYFQYTIIDGYPNVYFDDQNMYHIMYGHWDASHI